MTHDNATDQPLLHWLRPHCDQRQTGCVHVTDATSTHRAQAYLHDGHLVSVHVTGFRQPVASRLRTAGVLNATQFDTLVAASNGDDRDAEIGARAVRDGMISTRVIHAIHREGHFSALTAISTWPDVTATFVADAATDKWVVPGVPVPAIETALARRKSHWAHIWQGMTGAPDRAHAAIPQVTLEGPTPLDLSPDSLSLLATLDGTVTVDHIAGRLGLTRFETGHLLHMLWLDGLVAFTDTLPERLAPPAAPAPRIEPVPVTAPPVSTIDEQGQPATFPIPAYVVAQLGDAETHLARLRTVLSDVRLNHDHAVRALRSAEAEEMAAREAFTHAQNLFTETQRRSALARRTETEWADRVTGAQRDTDRAEAALAAVGTTPPITTA